jgi:UDP-N-acetylglucosamine--N-acetylmuramyl-(pentapeptide) pyrophosphoryl-undecaprenol N-acetylglucosamine transferase
VTNFAAPLEPGASLEGVRVLLAAGGTAGHIFPAIAASSVLVARGATCALVGATGGMEARLALQAGLEFFGVSSGKLDRSRPDPRALWRALKGFGDAVRVTRAFKPNVTVGFGGFASFPGVAAAWLTRTKLVMHEANAYPGLVTRAFKGAAVRIALADEATMQHLERDKCVVVGMPVREQRLEAGEARVRLGLEPEKRTVLVMGGSQGSVALNKLLPPILERALSGQDVQVLHQTGRGRLDEVRPRVAHLPWYRCAEFVDGVAAWSAATLALTRAGMSTIADAAFHGVPLIVVPLPSSSEDHQRKNGERLAARGAGRWFAQGDLESGLVSELEAVMLSCLQPSRWEAMHRAALEGSPEGAAARLAAVVARVALSNGRGANRVSGAEPS